MVKAYKIYCTIISISILISCNNTDKSSSTNNQESKSRNISNSSTTYPIKWINDNNETFEVINDTIAKYYTEMDFEEQTGFEEFEGKYYVVGKKLFFNGISNKSSEIQLYFSLADDNKSLNPDIADDVYKLSEENPNRNIDLKEYQFDKSKIINNLKQENLKGNVKSVIFKCSDYIIDRGNGKGTLIKRLDNDISVENEKREYSKDGFITRLIDYKGDVKYNFDEFGKINNKSFEYDYRGFILTQKTAFAKITYDFTDTGRLLCKIFTNNDKRINERYSYNDKDDIETIYQHISNNDETSLFTYRQYKYLAYDDNGNWIKRIATKYVPDMFDDFIIKENKEYECMIEERIIEYWDSDLNTNVDIQNKTASSNLLNDFKGGTFKNNTNIYVIFIPRNNKGGKANMIDGQRIEKYVYDIKDDGCIYLHEGTFNNSHTGERQAVDSKAFYLENGYIYYMLGGRKYKYYPSNDKLRDYFYY